MFFFFVKLYNRVFQQAGPFSLLSYMRFEITCTMLSAKRRDWKSALALFLFHLKSIILATVHLQSILWKRREQGKHDAGSIRVATVRGHYSHRPGSGISSGLPLSPGAAG